MAKRLKTQVALYLDDEAVELLDKLAEHTRLTKQVLLREAVTDLFVKYGFLSPKRRRKP